MQTQRLVPDATRRLPEPTQRLTPEQGRLVEQAMPMVRSVVHAMSAGFPSHTDRDELVQAGTLGLVEAATRFDPLRGVPFDRWAALRVRGAVVDALRALDVATRSTRSGSRALEQARSELQAELGRAPMTGELADRLRCSVAELAALQGQLHRGVLLSLDAPQAGDGDDVTTLAASLRDPGAAPDAVLEQRERDSYLHDALACLPDRLQDVVVAYYLNGEPTAEIADRLGVTESRVSQLRGEALRLMRGGLDVLTSTPERPRADRQGRYSAAVAARSSYATRLTSRAAQAYSA